MDERASVLIAGGGVIGSAIAAAPVEGGGRGGGVLGVCVLDLDLAGRYASWELTAGGARATWWHEVNVASCRDTIELFEREREALSFRQRGYLWLYDDRS